jgi:hypothetical protein
MEVPQARMGWSGALVNLVPSVTGDAMFTARTGAPRQIWVLIWLLVGTWRQRGPPFFAP